MPLVQTRGAASAQGFGEFSQPAAGPVNYIEDVFSTYLYTGNSSTQTINNGIDLAGKGGLVWVKQRGPAGNNHQLADTVRGASSQLASNTTADATSETNRFTSFNSNGFSLDSSTIVNNSTQTYCSWTFREQAKFMDVVTWSGTGSPMTINHNLGSVPGMIIMKKLGGPSGTGNWIVWHRGLPRDGSFEQYQSFVVLNLTNGNSSDTFLTATPTSSSFSIDSSLAQSSATYVAYLFAHDAGGFGAAGTDNVISCGTFTTDASANATVNLGYEPQYVLVKCTDATSDWFIIDNMRGWDGSNNARLVANKTDAETASNVGGTITATGFNAYYVQGTYIYMAIRRPMKPPTSGTQVFSPNRETTTTSPQTLNTGFPVDLSINTLTNGQPKAVMDRLRGGTTTFYNYLNTASTAAEATGTAAGIGFDNNVGIVDNSWWVNTAAIFWNFRRAPGFFDEVCYKGSGATGNAIAHNLTVAPELIIIKGRSGTIGTNDWQTLNSFTSTTYQKAFLNLTDANTSFAYTDNGGLAAQPTTTTFTVDNVANYNNASTNYVAYLFSTCPGVSKVGSYTGTGATQTINCGFTGGARFVLIKRSSDSGGWYVWDTARGMVAGTDPFLALNTTSAETNLNTVYTATTGFQIVGTDPELNASGSTYIFLAIA